MSAVDGDPDDRATYAAAFDAVKTAAFPPGEYVGQESFMSAGEIVDLARRAGVGPGVRVLDVCCGIGAPGRHVTRTLGGDYLGVDRSAAAVAVARDLAGDLPCRFTVGAVPPLPAGPFDVVLLLETLLAFPDKQPLLAAVAAALAPGGRFALTAEEGDPLTDAERAAMPGGGTVHPVPLPDLLALLAAAGLEVTWQADVTAAHRTAVDAIVRTVDAARAQVADRVGDTVVDDLLVSHRLWSQWFAQGRVRKVALVARRPG